MKTLFEWWYKRLAKNIMSNIDLKSYFLGLMADEKIQDEIVQFTDVLFDRYKAKVMGTIGGSLKGSLEAEDSLLTTLPIPSKYRKFLKNPVIRGIAESFLAGKQTEKKEGGLP